MNVTTAGFLGELGYAPIALARTSFGHLELEAKINGAPSRLLVDTGASETVIDQTSADRLGVRYSDDGDDAIGCGLGGTAHHATVSQLRFGTTELSGVAVRVMDLSQVNNALEAKTGSRIDGIIGADFLERGEAVIEFAQKTLHVRFSSDSSS